MDSNTCYLYWIHRASENDITTQGYVGITKDFAKRFADHMKTAKSRSKNHKLYNALNRHDDFLFEVILCATREYCLDLENKLRPTKNIGLNHSQGGKYTPSSKVINLETKEKLRIAALNAYANNPELANSRSKAKTGKKLSLETKQKQSDSLKGVGVGWKNSSADFQVWKLAFKMHDEFVKNPNITYYKLSKIFDLKTYQTTSILKLLKTNWNPYQDDAFKNYIEGN